MLRAQSIHHEVQSNFLKHENQAHDRERGKSMAGRAKHEILAPKAEFFRFGVRPGVVVFHGKFCSTRS